MNSLSPALEEILARLPEHGFREALRAVFHAASCAMHALGDLDLVKYESESLEATLDLSLWEETAPTIRNTVVEVNRLLEVLDVRFPEPVPEVYRSSPEFDRIEEVHSLATAARKQLFFQVSRLGERIRSPDIVADRWNLLAELHDSRARFREEIADFVYAAVSLFADVPARDVVAGYAEAERLAVALRGELTLLGKLYADRLRELPSVAAEDVQWNASQMLRELDAFGAKAAYQQMRVQDKRVIMEFRQALKGLASQERLQRSELLDAGNQFLEFLRTSSLVSQRKILLQHDRELAAACGVGLERVRHISRADLPAAGELFAEVVRQAMPLCGRDRAFDVFLFAKSQAPTQSDSGQRLDEEVEHFVSLLAGLPLY